MEALGSPAKPAAGRLPFATKAWLLLACVTGALVLASKGFGRAGRAGVGEGSAEAEEAPGRRLFGFGIARVNDRFVELPTCVIDVEQSGLSLAEAAGSIRTAVRVCRVQDTPEQRLLCASVIADIVAFVGFGAEFLEGSAQQCADHLVPGDLCAETVTELLAGLAQVVQSSVGIRTTCMNLTRNELLRRHFELSGGSVTDLSSLLRDGGRRLDAVEDKHAAELLREMQGPGDSLEELQAGLREEERQLAGTTAAQLLAQLNSQQQSAPGSLGALAASAQAAQAAVPVGQSLEQIAAIAALNQTRRENQIFNGFKCFLHASEAASFVARAGDVISASVLDCTPRNKAVPVGEQACEMDVVGIIESFTFAANSIARAIFRCPTIVNICAQCAANIINVISSTEALLNSASGLNLCTAKKEDEFVEHETHLLPAPIYEPPPPPRIGQDPEKARLENKPTIHYYRRDEGVLPIFGPQNTPPPEPNQPLRPPPPGSRPGAQPGPFAEPPPGPPGSEHYGPEP